MAKRFRVYMKKIDTLALDLHYHDDDQILRLRGDELIAAVAKDTGDTIPSDWDFVDSDTIKVAVVEINADGWEGKSYKLAELGDSLAVEQDSTCSCRCGCEVPLNGGTCVDCGEGTHQNNNRIAELGNSLAVK